MLLRAHALIHGAMGHHPTLRVHAELCVPHVALLLPHYGCLVLLLGVVTARDVLLHPHHWVGLRLDLGHAHVATVHAGVVHPLLHHILLSGHAAIYHSGSGVHPHACCSRVSPCSHHIRSHELVIASTTRPHLLNGELFVHTRGCRRGHHIGGPYIGLACRWGRGW